ncbi:MAG: alkaline phosphatase family protein [Burkholderiales bacterium]|nr:alkaline phosphatase family protein [Burkholderiales bacterium]
MRLPDYDGGSLLNLMASIAAGRGASTPHAILDCLPPEALVGARNIVFFLVDGLGYNYLAELGRGGALFDHLAGRLTSVFPSTTASAITTSFTGASPQEHGHIGWFNWFPEAEVVAAALPFRRRGDDVPLGEIGIRSEQLFAARSLFDRLDVRSLVVSHQPIIDSDYSRHFCGRAQRSGYSDLTGLVDCVVAAVRASSERKYVYAYYPGLDALAHKHGIASTQTATRLTAIDAAFADLLRRLSGTDTALVVSADHGFIDTPPDEALELERFPQLAELLRLPLTGEPRVAFCHVTPGATEEFIRRAQGALGARAEVRASREIIAAGWFGPGTPHPRLADRAGDVTLVMRGHGTIRDHLPGEKRHVLIGNHGGVTEDEMLVPLVVARL